VCIFLFHFYDISCVQVRELENELANEKKTARDTGRSTRPSLAAPVRQRPPLAPMRQRQPSNNMPPPPGPSKLRFAGKGTSAQNKENIPVRNKAVVDKAAGKARRVSLVPMMRQIPLQPKRRSSIAILPSQSERISVFPDKRPVSRLSHIQMPTRAQAAAEPAVDATPDVRGKFKRLEFGSSNKFSSPPMWKSRNNVASPQQRLRLQSGSGNASKLCFSIQKRVALGSPTHQPRASLMSGAGSIFDPAVRDQIMAGRLGNAQRVFNSKRRMSVL
jgi:kinesin family protein C2/C3